MAPNQRLCALFHKALAKDNVCIKLHCQPNRVSPLWRTSPTWKWGFMQTFKGKKKTAHIYYVYYCHGKKRFQSFQRSTHRMKYLAPPWSRCCWDIRICVTARPDFLRSWQQGLLRDEGIVTPPCSWAAISKNGCFIRQQNPLRDVIQ